MRLSLIPTALLLTGCVSSGYSQFYTPASGATPEAIAVQRAAPPPETPALDHIGRADTAVIAAYERHGYDLIGYSKFNSGHREHDSNAIDEGKKVKADLVVVIDPHYTGSNTVSVPLTTPTTQTSYTNGSATAYGSGGTATAYGHSTTTTYGTQTTYIPMTIHRVDYGALYFIKAKPRALGVKTRELSDGERVALQSNHGAAVEVVVDDSPAFRADVLPGDILVSLDGEPVSGPQGLHDLLEARRGKTVKLTISRGGQAIEKSVQLGTD